ncbi:MAG TPA: dihydrolipoamide acetyltransferase family protein [Burkholderiaceae bacterium]|nr:dihydrolipoamide acetyltransferase family protein [Burkholderiaceae bacterium]
MGIHVIRMPDIGEGIAEVELVSWHVQPGDSVAEDQPLAEVMTDKATVEIPSSVAGKVLTLGGALGQVMAVGSELIRIEVDGAGNASEASASPATASAAATAAPAQVSARPAPVPVPAVMPPQPKPAAENAVAAVAWVPLQAGSKPLASPAVRQRAWDLGIELRYVSGSGDAGRITHADLDDYVAREGGRSAPRRAAAGYAEKHDEVAVPVIGLRRKIDQKMQESKRRIPHFTYVEEIDMSELEALRLRLNEIHGAARGRLTVLPFLIRAVVLALREFPQINARFDDDAGIVTRYGAVHMGIATQTEGGLMVPVVRHAEARDLWSSAAEIARLAEAARTGHAAREELSGSTITITSLGALGGLVSTPVINYPEVGIVGVNRMVLRPVIRDGAVVARQMMNLSSSFDHRVVDGLHAAQFVQALRRLLECPAALFLD